MTEIKEAALRKAADWWFDFFIQKDQFKDNGGKEISNRMAGVMMAMIAEKHPVEEGQREKFFQTFSESVQVEREKWTEASSTLIICDYHPGHIIRRAMEGACIDPSRCPIKTEMHIGLSEFGDGVRVTPGYDAETTQLCDMDGELPTERWALKYTYVSVAGVLEGEAYPEIREDFIKHYYNEEGMLKGAELAEDMEPLRNHETKKLISYTFDIQTWHECLVDGEWVRGES